MSIMKKNAPICNPRLFQGKSLRNPLWICSVIGIFSLYGCAAIQQYPADPEDTGQTLNNLKPYFDGSKEKEYDVLTDDSSRTIKRNEIVSNMMKGYDIEFFAFEKQLTGFSNSVSVGADLIGLTLGGLTATAGGAGAKAAFGAASVGVLGANTTINKDLFYQKTLPALMAQMEANRAQKELPIDKGLAQPDSKYSLTTAYRDLQAYKAAGSLQNAITSITQSAGSAKQTAENDITFVRSSETFAELSDTEKIQAAYKKLSDSQVLNLTKLMQSNLATRPAGIQSLVKGLDPTNSRLSGNVTAARDVMNAWIAEDDMSPANVKQWTDAISAAEK
jgi:hypothetical protein